jgi:hypothetical protein
MNYDMRDASGGQQLNRQGGFNAAGVLLRAEAVAVDLVNPHLVADNSLGGVK